MVICSLFDSKGRRREKKVRREGGWGKMEGKEWIYGDEGRVDWRVEEREGGRGGGGRGREGKDGEKGREGKGD